MDKKAVLINIVVCVVIGGVISYFSSARWTAASLWVFAAVFINGSFAFYEDARPSGFDNPTGDDTPAFAKGFGAIKFWAVSLLVAATAACLGIYVQAR